MGDQTFHGSNGSVTSRLTSEDTRPTSRRHFLAASAGAVAAVVAVAAGATPAAAEGEVLHVGDEFTTATSVTRLENQANNADVLEVVTGGGGDAVVGHSSGGNGVSGHTHAAAKSGVFGNSTAVGGYGVYGSNENGDGHGILGEGSIGVHGWSTHGTAVFADTADGVGIRSNGRMVLSKAAGIATLARGNTSVIVDPGLTVTAKTVVLLTPRGDPGLRQIWVTLAPSSGLFTIHASSASAKALHIAWLMIG